MQLFSVSVFDAVAPLCSVCHILNAKVLRGTSEIKNKNGRAHSTEERQINGERQWVEMHRTALRWSDRESFYSVDATATSIGD